MSDTNLQTSSSAVIAKLLTLIGTASVDDLLKLSRTALLLENTENESIEQAIDSRIQTLVTNASPEELSKLGRSIRFMLEPDYSVVEGELIPSQTNKEGSFLSSNGSNDSWGGVTTKNISEISTDNPSNNSVLKYDSTQSKFVPTNLWPFKVETTLPGSGNLGDVVIVNDVFNIWDGTSWISI